MTEPDDLLTLSDVARLARISVSSVRRLIANGDLRSVLVTTSSGGPPVRRVHPVDWNRFVEARTEPWSAVEARRAAAQRKSVPGRRAASWPGA